MCLFTLYTSANSVWLKFYETPLQTSPISGTNIKLDSRNDQYFIYNCLFIDSTIKSAIYFTSDYKKLLLSDSYFNNCSSNTNYNGGAIHFSCSSSIVQNRVCGYKSKTSAENSHHSYTYIKNGANLKNYIFESSFSACGDTSSSLTNSLWNGNIEVNSINTSFCEAQYDPGIYIDSSSDLCTILYSSFCNNTSPNIILEFVNSNNFNFKLSNVLNNKKTSSYLGILLTNNAIVIIENCSFLGNQGSGKEFYAYNSQILIKNSYYDRLLTSGNVQTENIMKKYSICKLQHFSSYICEAEYPFFNERSSSRMILKRRKFFNLKNNYLNQLVPNTIYHSLFQIVFRYIFINKKAIRS